MICFTLLSPILGCVDVFLGEDVEIGISLLDSAFTSKFCMRLQFIQINNGAVEVEPSVMGAPPSNNAQVSTKKVKVPLNSRYISCFDRVVYYFSCQCLIICFSLLICECLYDVI